MHKLLNNRFLPESNKFLTLFILFWLAYFIENIATNSSTFNSHDKQSSVFSAVKANETLQRLLPENRPHPVGTELNKLVAERIISEFSAIDINAQLQQRFQCKNANRASAVGCADIGNIIVTLPGTNPDLDKYVVVSAHYDSQATTPGIADDLAGVAAMIELAAYFKRSPVEHSLLFLITDSEETGLLGAQAFTQHHELSDKIGFIVNLEAAGTSGPSTLFETSSPNALAIEIFANSVSRPVGSSTLHEIYKILPNTTDLAIHFVSGSAGLNLAFFKDKQHYHTPLDNLRNLSLDSLQHHGNNAFELIRGASRGLKNTELHAQNYLYVDVVQRFLIKLEQNAVIWLAFGLSVLSLLLYLKVDRSLKAQLSYLFFPGALLLTVIGGSALQWLLTTTSGLYNYWYSVPYASLYLYLLFTLLLLSYWVNWFLNHFSSIQLSISTASWLLLISGLLALTKPIFVMELFITGIAFLLFSLALLFKFKWRFLILIVLFAMPSMVWLSLLNLILPIGAFRAAAILAVIMLIIALPFSLLSHSPIKQNYGVVAMFSLMIAGLVWWHHTVGYRAESPQHVSLEYVEDFTSESVNANWLISDTRDPVPGALQEKLHFSQERVAKLPISNKVSFWADADIQNLPKTRIRVTSNEIFEELRVISFELQPADGSYISSFYIPAKLRPLSIIINDEEFHFEPERLYHDHHAFICFSDACANQQYSIVFDRTSSSENIEFLVSSQSLGLGPQTDIGELRPNNAQPYNRGDTRTVWWKQTINSAALASL